VFFFFFPNCSVDVVKKKFFITLNDDLEKSVGFKTYTHSVMFCPFCFNKCCALVSNIPRFNSG